MTETKKEWEEKFDELMFVNCPTEEKEQFFWRWTNEGKKTLKSFISSLLKEETERAIWAIREKVRNLHLIHDMNEEYARKEILDWCFPFTPPQE